MSTMDTGTTPLRELIRARRAEMQKERSQPSPVESSTPPSPMGGAVLGAAAAVASSAGSPTTPLRELIRARRAKVRGGAGGVDEITVEPGGLARRNADDRALQAFYAGEIPGDPADPQEAAAVVAARSKIPPEQAMETVRQLRANPQGVWQEAPAGPTRERAITDQAIRDYALANGEAGTTGVAGSFMEGVAGPFKAAGRGAMDLIGRAKEAAGAAVGATIDGEAGRDITRAGTSLRTKAEALAATGTPRPEGAAAEVASMAGGLAPYLAMPHRAILPLIGFNSGTEALQAYQAELERRGDPHAGAKAAAAAAVVGPTEAALNAIPVGRLLKALEATEPGFAAFLKRQMGHALAGGVGMGGADAAHQAGGLAIGAQDQYDVGRTVKATLTGAAASVAVGAGSEALASGPAAVGRATRPLRELIAERRAVNAAGKEADASGRAMREEQGAAAVDPSATRPTTIQEQVPTPPTPEGAGPILTPDDRLTPGDRVVAPDGRVHVVGNQVGKDQVLLKPEDGGRMRQASAGQLGGRGWRRVQTPSDTAQPPEGSSETPRPATPALPDQAGRETASVQTTPQTAQGAREVPAQGEPSQHAPGVRGPGSGGVDASEDATPIPGEQPPAAPPKPPPKMIEYKPPGARKPEGPARPWSRRDIEDRILKEYSGSAGKDVADALDTRDEEQNFSDGSGFTRFAGPLPVELKEAIAHRPELRTILKTNQPTLRSNGADYVAELGVDRYVARLERAFLGEVTKAKEAMREDRTNPVARFLVALHDNLPKGKRPTKETIDADSVPVGSTFEIDGHNFTVEEGEGGYRILRDGNQFPPVELDAFGKLPIDKGSLEKPAEPPPAPPPPKESERVKPAQGSLLGERFEGGTTGGQRSMFDTRKEPAPDLEREYPGIRRGESIEDYKRRMGEEDTPSMFGEQGPEKPAPEDLGGDDVAPFSPRRRADGDLTLDAPGRSPLDPSQPTDASVAQRVEDRPRNVAGLLRQARKAGAAQSSKREAVKTIRQIMDALASGVNTRPATVGHNRAHLRKALGFYRLIQGGIVMGKTDDYRTYAHELGHQFHEMLFPGVRSDVIRAGRRARIQDAFPQAWHADLFKLGKALYGNRKPNVGGYETEGWAELVRYIITDPKTGQSLAPTAYNGAIKLLETNHPEVMQLVLRAREQLAVTLNSQDPILRYLPAPGKAEDNVWGRAARDILDDITTMLFDDKTRLRTLNRDLGLIDPKTGKHRLGVERDPEAAARRVPGETYADVHRILHDGPFDPSNPAGPKVGKGLVEILEPVRQHLIDADGRGGLWQRYMIAKRVREKRAQGYGGIFAHSSDAEIEKFIKANETRPGFKQAAEDFQKLNEWFIGEYAVGHGLLSPEQAQQIIAKNLHYITFRHIDPTADITKSIRGGGAMADRSSGVRRFKGSSQDLTDPLVAFIQSVHNVAANARKNGATRTLTDLLRSNAMGKLGVPEVNRWIEKVDVPMQATRVGEEAFRRAVAKELGQMPEFTQLPQAEQDMLIDGLDQLDGQTFWSPAAASERTRGQQLISVLRNGKREWYKLNDPRLFEIYQGMHRGDSTIPRWINFFMMIPRHVLQAGATSKNITFAATNFLRDLTTAMITGEAPIRRMKARVRGMVSAFAGGDTARLMENAGVSMSSVLAEYSGRDGKPDLGKLFDDRRFARTILSKLNDPTRGVPGRIGRALGDLVTLGPIERFNQRIEMATRGGEFEAVRGGSSAAGAILAAADAARDVTLDFQRGGRGPKTANRYIPFFNAGFIGAHKTWRSIRDNPRRTAARVAAFAVAPALGLMLLNKDDEQYWRLPQLTRDRYYFIPVGTDENGQRLYSKIPKQHGLGFAAVVAERAFAAALGRDPTMPPGERGDSRAFEGFFTSLATSMLPSVSAGFLQPIIEHAANYDFYRGRPIENSSERRLEPRERFNSRTSDFARALGHWTNRSPIVIDHYIYGYGAGLGRDVTNYVLNPLTRRALIPGMKSLGFSEPPPPAAPGVDQGKDKLEDLPILRGFIARTSRTQTEAILRWQAQFEELKAVEATWKNYTDREDEAAKAYAERYGEEHRRQLDAYRAMSSYDRAIKKRMKEYCGLSAQRDGEKAVADANAISAEVHRLIQEGMQSVREALAKEPAK